MDMECLFLIKELVDMKENGKEASMKAKAFTHYK